MPAERLQKLSLLGKYCRLEQSKGKIDGSQVGHVYLLDYHSKELN